MQNWGQILKDTFEIQKSYVILWKRNCLTMFTRKKTNTKKKNQKTRKNNKLCN